MSISSARPPTAVSRSRSAIRSRFSSRERVAATAVETSTSRASNMAAHRVSRSRHTLRPWAPWTRPSRAPACGDPTGRARWGWCSRTIAADRTTPPTVVRRTARSGAASAPPRAPTTLRIEADPADGTVTGEAWGDGAEWVLDRLPRMLGADDDPTGFEPLHKPIADAWRRYPHWRLGATDLVMESLVPTIIEQKVTGQEAFGAFQRDGAPLRRARAGTAERAGPARAAVGPADSRTAARDPVVGVAAAAGRRGAVAPDPARGPGRLVAGAGRPGGAGGVRPAACARCRASACGPAPRCASGRWATPTRSASATTTSPPNIGYVLTGEPVDDEGLAALLEPYAGHRHRVQRLVELAGLLPSATRAADGAADAPSGLTSACTPTARTGVRACPP